MNQVKLEYNSPTRPEQILIKNLKTYAELYSDIQKLEIKSFSDNTLDELYAFPVFESDLAKSLSSSHPSQFLFNTRGLGLSSSIGLLQQNYASIEAFLEDDPEDSSHYEEIS